MPYFRINKIKNWFDVVVVNMFNKMPPEAHSISKNIFITSFRSWFISCPFNKLSEFLNENLNFLLDY